MQRLVVLVIEGDSNHIAIGALSSYGILTNIFAGARHAEVYGLGERSKAN